MIWYEIAGDWKHFTEKVKAKWDKLTDADLTTFSGKRGTTLQHPPTEVWLPEGPGGARNQRIFRRFEGETLRYFTSAGPFYGALLRRHVGGTIDVLETLGQSTSVGTAFCIGENAAGVAIWRLSIGGRDLPRGCVVLHRGFRSA